MIGEELFCLEAFFNNTIQFSLDVINYSHSIIGDVHNTQSRVRTGGTVMRHNQLVTEAAWQSPSETCMA